MSSLLNSCYDCSGAIGFPQAIGDDVVTNTTRAVHGPDGFNASCYGCTTCGGQTNTPTGFQFHYASQTFHIRLRNAKKTMEGCASYTPTYQEYTKRSLVCTESCSGSGKQRVTTMSKYGGGISPHVGAVTHKQHLNDIKRAQRTVVRGNQMSSSSFIRANRPMHCVSGSCKGLNKNTAATFIAINRYPPRSGNPTQSMSLPCCTSNVGTEVRGNNLPSHP